MNKLARNLAQTLLCASAALPLTAHADIRATATLDLSRFSLLRADGTPFAPSDFSQVTVQHRGIISSTNSFDNTFAGGTLQSQPVDLPVTCFGAACPVTGENDYGPLSGTPIGFYTNSDQRNSGAILSGDMRMQARSDTGMQALGEGRWDTDAEAVTLFEFSLNQAGTMTIEFDARPYVTLSRQQAVSEPEERGYAGLLMSYSMHNVTRNERVFWEIPHALNNGSQLFINSDYELANLIYDPGTLTFSYTTPTLNANETYLLWISGETVNRMVPAPEPSSLAMFGAGLAALTILGWRRKAGALLRDRRETREAK